MKVILAILSLAAFGSVAIAQSNAATPPKCTLTVAQAPTIRGFKLGMTTEQIKARFPNVVIKKSNEFGYVDVEVDASSVLNAEKVNFDNVGNIRLAFLDERLVSIGIRYLPSAYWENVRQFVPLISAKYNLNGDWQSDDISSRLACNGFKVEVYASNTSASFSIAEPSINETIRQRRTAKEEAARRAFQP